MKKNRRKFCLAIAMAALMLAMPLSAMVFATDAAVADDNEKNDAGVVIDGIRYELTGTTATVIADNYRGEIIIPETVTHDKVPYNVTKINSNAFKDCTSLTSVTIPKTVETIGSNYLNAFIGCVSLQFIKVSEGNENFYSKDGILYCISPSYGNILVTYPAGKSDSEYTIEGDVSQIYSNAFDGCKSLTKVTIPGTVKGVGANPFHDCPSLKCIKVSDGERNSYGEKYYDIDGVLFFEKGEEGEKSTYLWQYPAGKETNDGTYTIPDNVWTINDYAFSGCKNLTGITMGDNVGVIGMFAFDGCTSLKSVKLPNYHPEGSLNEAKIMNCAFNNCSSLEKLEFPEHIGLDDRSYSYQIFFGCKSLNEITVDSNNKHFCVDGKGALYYLKTDRYGNVKEKILLKCPVGMEGKYTVEPAKSSDIDTTIAAYAFEWCTKLTEVVLPSTDNWIAIQPYTFYMCSSLDTVNIPNNVYDIDGTAFFGCTSLKNISIDNQYFELKDGMLLGVLPDDKYRVITYLAESTETSCTIPANVTEIDSGAFFGVNNLIKFEVHEDNETFSSSVDGYLLSKDGKTLICCPSGITECVIPSGVETIRNYAITGPNVEKIVLPDNPCRLESVSVYDCTNLSSIKVQNLNTTLVNNFIAFNDDVLHEILLDAPEEFVLPNISVGNVIFKNAPIAVYGDIEVGQNFVLILKNVESVGMVEKIQIFKGDKEIVLDPDDYEIEKIDGETAVRITFDSKVTNEAGEYRFEVKVDAVTVSNTFNVLPADVPEPESKDIEVGQNFVLILKNVESVDMVGEIHILKGDKEIKLDPKDYKIEKIDGETAVKITFDSKVTNEAGDYTIKVKVGAETVSSTFKVLPTDNPSGETSATDYTVSILAVFFAALILIIIGSVYSKDH